VNSELSKTLENFFEPYPIRTFAKGHILVQAGDDPECIFALVKGRVKQYDVTYRGDEVVLNVFQPPAYFPMSFAINRTPNEYIFEADTAVELKKVPFDDITTFVRSNPEVLYDLLSRVYRGTDGMLRRMAHLMASTAKSRVLYELITECRRFGESTGSGITIALNETDIGARSGLSRETVNREMSKLKAEGLIRVDHKQITVPKLEDLERTLGTEL